MADLTKANGQLMDWSTLDDTGGVPTLESNPLDSGEGLDASIEAILHIDMCHQDTTAAAGDIGCIVLIKSGTTDEDWHEHRRMLATLGTANLGNCDAESAGAQANVYIASTTNFETPGDVYFMKDEGTLADSCLIVNKDYVNDDYIICIDNLVNTYDAADNTYDIVDQWNVTLPEDTKAAKVLFYNNDADATFACRVRYSLATDIE